MSAVIEVNDVTLELDGRKILDNVSFSIEKGSFTVIAGKNGAGKSQLLKIIKGLKKPTSGTILINGEDMTKNRKKRLASVGLVFQNSDLQFVGETVEKDIMFGPENLGWGEERIRKKTEEMLSLFSLTELRNRRPSTLSGGEKRRLAIAGVLAMEVDTVFLDEPFTALDTPSVLTLIDTLITLHKEGVTLAVVSHEAERFLAHTDRVIILNKGRKVFDGPAEESPDELRKNDVYIPQLPFRSLTWKAM
ncbi:MAG: energy-coupling factor ABC transporter ATP-binding protein [Bullifex sp.]